MKNSKVQRLEYDVDQQADAYHWSKKMQSKGYTIFEQKDDIECVLYAAQGGIDILFEYLNNLDVEYDKNNYAEVDIDEFFCDVQDDLDEE